MPTLITWLVVLLLVGGYVAFFYRRYRKEQEAKRDATDLESTTRQAMSPPIATAMPTSPPLAPDPTASAWPPTLPAPTGPTGWGPPDGGSPPTPADTAMPMPMPMSMPMPGGGLVVDLLPGIRLPDDLVPRADLIARPNAHDRVVFITTETPADVVRDRLTAALAAIGTEARWDPDGWQALLVRGDHTGWLKVHPSPNGVIPLGTVLIPSVPTHTVCAEFWTDALP